MTQRKITVQSNNAMPTVQITSNRNRLKVYGKLTHLPKIFLKGGSQFEFEFFNPLQERIGLKIYLNDSCINEAAMLILKPGEHGFLERYIDDSARKFLFDTYTVNGNNAAAMKAIEKNGLVKVEFFKEERIDWHFLQNQYNNYKPSNPWETPTINWGNGTGGYVNGTYTTDNNQNYSCYYSSDINYKSDTSFAGSTKSSTSHGPVRKFKKSLETGRIEKGEQSNQTFGQTLFTPCVLPFYSVEMQIMPESTRQLNINENIKRYCPGCRYRIRDINWKFCPKCSTDLRNI